MPRLRRQHHSEIERALRLAMRVIEDDIALQERLGDRAPRVGRDMAVERIEARARDRKELLEVLHDSLHQVLGACVDD